LSDPLTPESEPDGPPPSSTNPRQRRLAFGAAIAVALAAGFVTWLLVRNDHTSSSTRAQLSAAVAVTPGRLRSLAVSAQHPVFWLGPEPGFTYELTQTTDGRIYVRYLPHGVAIGVKKPYLTVATYPFPGAFAAIRKQAAVKGAVLTRLADGGLALLDTAYPQSVHLAYPGVNYQIEVFDPSPGRAMELVAAGKLSSFGRLTAAPPSPATTTTGTPSTSASAPSAASVAALEALAAQLGHPIYWAGPKTGYTYELTRAADGRVYIRYLPAGVRVGDPRPGFLTVATYPFPGAYTAVKRTAKGAVKLTLAHGGIGVVDGQYPQSIHLAYPGVAYQVEVFDPSPSAGRKLVAAGRIVPVP
jgi:hypothetical protein